MCEEVEAGPLSSASLKLVELERPRCRKCGSEDVRRAHVRLKPYREELTQYYHCRDCGATFSADPDKTRSRAPGRPEHLIQWSSPHEPEPMRVWDFPDDFKVHFAEDDRAAIARSLSAHGFFGTPLYRKLRRTTHRGDGPGVWPGGVDVSSLREICRITGVSPADMEAKVVRVFKLSADKSLSGPFPLRLGQDWAWFAGLFFSCGTFVERDRAGGARERSVVFRIDASVLDVLKSRAAASGVSGWTLSSYMQYQNKTFAKARAIMPNPFYQVLVALGLPHVFRAGRKAGGRKTSTREAKLSIPRFVLRGGPQLRRAFVEGYLNGTKFQAWNYRKIEKRSGSAVRTQARGADVRFLSTSERDCRDFAAFVMQVLNDHGVTGSVRRTHAGRKKFCLGYIVTSPWAVDALFREFDLHRENVKVLEGAWS